MKILPIAVRTVGIPCVVFKKCAVWLNCAFMQLTTLEIKIDYFQHFLSLIKGEYLVKNTTDIRIDVIFYD